MTVSLCATHPEESAAAICAGCDRGLCPECWTHSEGESAWCTFCAELVTRPVPTVIPVATVGLAIALMLLLSRAVQVSPAVAWGGAGVGAALAAIAALRWHRRATKRRQERRLEPRRESPPSPRALRGHPYRGAARRIGRRIAPPLSGTMAVAVVAGALAVTGGVIPALLRLPRWLELEVVIGAWWLVWSVTLTVLLYRGWRVARDFR